eukprot:Skav200252  [mRNA]  locus=scaffold128:3272:4564:+ [translate_table: standard]
MNTPHTWIRKARSHLLLLYAFGHQTTVHQLDPTSLVVPGFNVETVEYRNFRLTVWDIGGQDIIRPLWRHYLIGAHAMIFVVDSCSKRSPPGGGTAEPATGVLQHS